MVSIKLFCGFGLEMRQELKGFVLKAGQPFMGVVWINHGFFCRIYLVKHRELRGEGQIASIKVMAISTRP